MRAILYSRLSSVHDASTSIVRQTEDLRALAARMGWIVVAEPSDAGVSGRRSRAKADEAVRMIESGEADVLAVWKLDRFTRQGWDGLGRLSRALDARERAGRPALFYALQDGLDSTQSAFRMVAGVLSEIARTEAENISTRNRSSRAHLPRVGRFGGGVAPWAYRTQDAPDGPGRILVPHPEEAPLAQEVAARLLDGASVGSIARDLTARGIPTPRSPYRSARDAGRPLVDEEGVPLDRGSWSTISVRRIMTSDALLGRVTEWIRPDPERNAQRPRLVRGADGQPLTPFAPVLDLSTLMRLRERLGTLNAPPVERRVKPGRELSGVAYCAICNGKLYVRGGQARPAYRCTVPGQVTCPGVQVNAELLERFVSERFLAIAGSAPEFEVVERILDAPGADELAEVEAGIRETLALLADDATDVPPLYRRLESLKARRSELRALRPSVEVKRVATGRTLGEAWDESLTTAERRALLLGAMDHVTVAPSSGARGRGPLDPERIVIRWHDGVADYDKD